ncbi:MAG: C-terminal helicase domain-containing protein, partial [Patescibacteria group bacterium]
RIEVARSGTVADKIEQEIYFVQKDQKLPLLNKLLQEYTGLVLIFSRTKYGAKKICRELQMSGHQVAEIHSNRSLSQRREALDGFRAGKYRVLVATDIAARGIDVTGIQLIVNFDLPENPEDYVHRIGRTGRAGQKGRAISMATFDQRNKIHQIEILTKTKLKVLGDQNPPAGYAQKTHTHSGQKPHQAQQKHFNHRRRFARRGRR